MDVPSYVRTVGLSRSDLNGAVGTATRFIRDKQRYLVMLQGHPAPILAKRVNIVPYAPKALDRCLACCKAVNLHAFPACSCGLSESDSDGSHLDFHAFPFNVSSTVPAVRTSSSPSERPGTGTGCTSSP